MKTEQMHEEEKEAEIKSDAGKAMPQEERTVRRAILQRRANQGEEEPLR